MLVHRIERDPDPVLRWRDPEDKVSPDVSMARHHSRLLTHLIARLKGTRYPDAGKITARPPLGIQISIRFRNCDTVLATSLFRISCHFSLPLCSPPPHRFIALGSSTLVYSPQSHCTRDKERIIHTLGAQSRGHLAGAPRRRTPATNHSHDPPALARTSPRPGRHVAAAARDEGHRRGDQSAARTPDPR